MREELKTCRTDPEPMTLEELKAVPVLSWVWIRITEQKKCDYYTDGEAYYRRHSDYSEGRGFTCGYPGMGWFFEYEEYGKTWLAYRQEPKE